MVAIKGCLCILGGFLVHFTLGSIYTFGNMSPYISSYLRHIGNPIGSGVLVWVFGAAIAVQGFSMPFGGLCVKKLGVRLTILLGGWIMSLGVILTYFTINHSYITVIVTYGLIFGLGTGLAYSVAIAAAIIWFPNKKGLVIGIVVGGFGLGSLVFNQVQTGFINPNNTKPNLTVGVEKYFDDPELLSRIPWCFVVIGCTYAVMQAIGVLLLFQPNTQVIQEIDINDENFNESSFGQSESIVVTIQDDNQEQKQVVEIVEESMKPMEAVKTRDFWLLCITFLFNGTANMFATSLYKTFGQTFIADDLFLAIVGSIASVFNAGSRVLWGIITDKINYKLSMRIMTFISGVLMATFYFASRITSPAGEKAMLTIWYSLILLTICGTFSMIPSATAKVFGTKNVATIYGMVFMSNALAGILGSLITSTLKAKIGYLGVFEVGAGFLFISFVLTFLHKKPNL